MIHDENTQTTLTDARLRSTMTTRPPPETHETLLERARDYARTVAIDVDLREITWEVSTRAKRRAGACQYDQRTGAVTIRLTWAAYQSFGWSAFRRVIRHELIHAWEYQRFGESSHGRRFRRKAQELGVDVHCPQFTQGRLALRCTNADCDWTAERHRASKVVTEPGKRRCGTCGDGYEVEHRATGRTWRTASGYRRARASIGEQW